MTRQFKAIRAGPRSDVKPQRNQSVPSGSWVFGFLPGLSLEREGGWRQRQFCANGQNCTSADLADSEDMDDYWRQRRPGLGLVVAALRARIDSKALAPARAALCQEIKRRDGRLTIDGGRGL